MLPFQGGLSQLPVNNENCILPTILTFFSPIASSPSNIIGSTFIYYNIVYYLSHQPESKLQMVRELSMGYCYICYIADSQSSPQQFSRHSANFSQRFMFLQEFENELEQILMKLKKTKMTQLLIPRKSKVFMRNKIQWSLQVHRGLVQFQHKLKSTYAQVSESALHIRRCRT